MQVVSISKGFPKVSQYASCELSGKELGGTAGGGSDQRVTFGLASGWGVGVLRGA